MENLNSSVDLTAHIIYRCTMNKFNYFVFELFAAVKQKDYHGEIRFNLLNPSRYVNPHRYQR